MDPVTIGLVISGVSAAVGAMGAIQQGNAAEAQGKSDAATMEYNAKVSENSAKAANMQTSAREDVERRQRRIQLGNIRASGAQSGLNDTGSLLDMYDQSAIDSELDILNSRYEGQLQAKGYGEQAALDRSQGANALANGKTAKRASYLNAGASLLQGAGSYYSGKADREYKTALLKSRNP